jgi:hypothetical protein
VRHAWDQVGEDRGADLTAVRAVDVRGEGVVGGPSSHRRSRPLHGHESTDADTRQATAPWYRTKTEPSTLDMLVKLRRQIITTRFLPTTPRAATTQEIMEVQQAWAQAAA